MPLSFHICQGNLLLFKALHDTNNIRRVASESSLSSINLNDSIDQKRGQDGKNNKPSTLSDRVVQAAVAGAVALKQSPLPDAVRSTVSYTIQKAQAIDKYIGVQSMCWEVGKVGINKALELDEQYNLHEKVSAALMTSATAVIRAGIAYQEAASYKDLRKERE
ncbi:hypothetical protein K502DRAFT_323603 [Neoconidiobolus thromboides FSU 785]|nr:hypothetical protein K502DRAFT_323603 [Neoconidiobolus thromboides FSU 785]